LRLKNKSLKSKISALKITDSGEPITWVQNSVYTMPSRRKSIYQFYAKNMNPSRRSSVRNVSFFAKGYVEENDEKDQKTDLGWEEAEFQII
jgi:hypothetical protein